MWSGPADQEQLISFGTTSRRFCVFQQHDRKGDRLYVFNPYSENFLWIDENAVGPIDAPEVRSRSKRPPGQNCDEAIFDD